ncbi:MAG: hypothetical protein H7836_15270 [Magnetococcus sp. YQC-3]
MKSIDELNVEIEQLRLRRDLLSRSIKFEQNSKKHLQSVKERKISTRQKIIIGAWVLSKARESADWRKVLINFIESIDNESNRKTMESLLEEFK